MSAKIRRALPPLHTPREDEFDPPTGSVTREKGQAVELVSCPTGLDAWLGRSYRAAQEILLDSERFRTCGAFAHFLPLFPVGRPVLAGDFERMDGDEHRQIRSMLASELTGARAVDTHRDWIGDVINAQLDALCATKPPADAYEEFAWPMAATVATRHLGLPFDIATTFHRKASLVSSTGTTAKALKDATFTSQVALRRAIRRPQTALKEGLLRRLLRRQGDQALTDEELVGVAAGVLMGQYSLANMVTFALSALLSRPHQWEALVADPDAAPDAVEELVRYLAVPEGVLRRATRDTTVDGQPVRQGDLVIAAIASANRDPALCDAPDELNVRRRPVAHLGFGHGPHYCIGHKFARFELGLALEGLARRVPSLRLVSPEPEFRADSTLGGPGRLLVRWD